jgi:hypothetical protein
MSEIIIKPIAKGAAVAIFLISIGVSEFTPEWWVAVVVLNLFF